MELLRPLVFVKPGTLSSVHGRSLDVFKLPEIAMGVSNSRRGSEVVYPCAFDRGIDRDV